MFVSAADLSDAVEQVTRLGARLLQLLQDLRRQLLEPPAPLHRHAPAPGGYGRRRCKAPPPWA